MQESHWIQTLQNIIKLDNLMDNKMKDDNVSEINTCMEEILEFKLKAWKFMHAYMDWLSKQHFELSIDFTYQFHHGPSKNNSIS